MCHAQTDAFEQKRLSHAPGRIRARDLENEDLVVSLLSAMRPWT